MRSFVLLQAYNHQSYDSKKQMVALPSIYKSRYGDPKSKIHKNCFTAPLVDKVEKKEMKFEEDNLKYIKK